MRRIKRTTMIAVTALAIGALFLLAPGAAAQTVGYPPGPPGPRPTVVPPAIVPPAVVPPAVPGVRAAVVATLPPVPGPARVSAGAVAFTGANILRWVATAVGLLGAGSLLVVFNRRRQGGLAT